MNTVSEAKPAPALMNNSKAAAVAWSKPMGSQRPSPPPKNRLNPALVRKRTHWTVVGQHSIHDLVCVCFVALLAGFVLCLVML